MAQPAVPFIADTGRPGFGLTFGGPARVGFGGEVRHEKLEESVAHLLLM